MIIPVLDRPHVCLNDGYTGFDEPAGKEQGLTEGMPSVAVADGIGFAVEFEGLSEFSGGEHGEGEPLVFGEPSGRGVIGEGGGFVQRFQEGSPLVEAAEVDSLGECEGVDAEVFAVWVTDDLPWIIFWAEEAGVLSGPCER